MIWEHHGPSHWVCRDYPGYVIHARCRRKRNAKTIFDSWKESWVEQTTLNNKVVQKFEKQDHIMTAMSKAVSYVEYCLKLQENIRRAVSTKVSKDQIEKLRKEFYNTVDPSKTWKTPIVNSTESNK